ncbi:MAG: Hsp20/alpha crystallin family protein [Verrucomicrobia bacterium]|nr:Hsp20/alpha crystallin family protein [Verrucomicrobiota bacterium]
MKDGEKDVFKQMDVIASEMENLFYRLFSPKQLVKPVCQHHWSPLADVYETADHLIIKLDLAGVKREEIGIALESDRLVVRGSRTESAPAGITTHHQMEINYGYFERVFHLRHGVRQEDIAARYDDGFLTVSITKEPPRERKDPLDIAIE